MSRPYRLLVLSLFLAPGPLLAQAPDPSLIGHRVRVLYRCELSTRETPPCMEGGVLRTYTGQVEALDGGNLHVRARSTEAERVVPMASIERLSVFEGRRGHTWSGLGLGLLGGAVIGGVIGSTQSFSGSAIFNEGQEKVVGVVLGATGGLLLGGIVGSVIKSDRWRSVSLGHGRIRVSPRLDAPGLTLTVAF